MSKYVRYVFISLLCCTHGVCEATELRVAASEYLGEPYTIYRMGAMHGGLIKDMFSRLEEELGVAVRYVDCPRKRVEQSLMSGELHVAPLAHPLWLSSKYQGDWTDSVFTLKEVLVMRLDNPLVYHGPEDLKGLNIGTILGYSYPKLEPYFAAKLFSRSDVQKVDQNLDMLITRRIDGYIVHDIAFHYLRKTDERAKQLKAIALGTETRMISWAVSKKTPVPLEQLNAFVRGLKKSGRMDEMLSRYRPLEAKDH